MVSDKIVISMHSNQQGMRGLGNSGQSLTDFGSVSESLSAGGADFFCCRSFIFRCIIALLYYVSYSFSLFVILIFFRLCPPL